MSYDEQKTRVISGLNFKLTSYAMPEQYDVLKDGDVVAYVRLRHGWLYVAKDAMGDPWWEIDDTDDVQPPLLGDGEFENAVEREYFLTKIADVINSRV